MSELLSPFISNEEYLYRGISELNWDYENNRPSSAIYKDSKGVSVDRDGKRSELNIVAFLRSTKDFFAICKIKTEDVRLHNATVLYRPIEQNIYHAEIHDSSEKIQLRGSKPKKLRDCSVLVTVQ